MAEQPKVNASVSEAPIRRLGQAQQQMGFPIEQGGIYSTSNTRSGQGYELGPKLRVPGKGIHCLEVDDDGAAWAYLHTPLYTDVAGPERYENL